MQKLKYLTILFTLNALLVAAGGALATLAQLPQIWVRRRARGSGP